MDTDIEKMMATYRQERAAPLKGLRSLYIYVDTPNSKVPFYENWCFITTNSADEETEKKIEAMHQLRMQAVKVAFPIIENTLREEGIEIIPVEKGMESQEYPRLTVTINLGKPKKKASFSATMYLEQQVQLVCNPAVKFRVNTWQSGTAKYKYKHNGVNTAFTSCLNSFLFEHRYANQS
jgi:hypothetical protein